MEPKKSARDRWIESDVHDKDVCLYTGSYALFTVANQMVEELNDDLDRYGLMMGKVKFDAKKLMNAFDQYHREMWGYIKTLPNHRINSEAFESDVNEMAKIVDGFCRENELWQTMQQMYKLAVATMSDKDRKAEIGDDYRIVKMWTDEDTTWLIKHQYEDRKRVAEYLHRSVGSVNKKLTALRKAGRLGEPEIKEQLKINVE